MPEQAACPSAENLRSFCIGRMALDECEQIAAHLESCQTCLAALETMAPGGDTMMSVLEAVNKVDDGLNPGVRNILERIQTIAGDSGHRQSDAGTSPSAGGEVELSNMQTLAFGASTEPTPTAGPAGRQPAPANGGFDFLAPAQGADEIGRLGPYRILKVLGQGGMGMVFQAEDPRLERMCALKVMLPHLAEQPGVKERFLREARAAAKLESDHVIPIFQVDEDRGVPYIAMPFLKGASLEDWLRKRQQSKPGQPVPVAVICKLGREIAKGLAAAHEKGMIHRDIKPANIWLDAAAGGRVKILDFGLARLAETPNEQHLTQSGMIMGTPSYMAPEQARGDAIDGRADLFSLGVVLYRLCTGELPFKGKDALSTLMALATVDPPPPASLNPTIPAALSELVTRLLAKEVNDRWQKAHDVVAAIQSLERKLATGKSASSAASHPSAEPRPAAGPAVPLAPGSARSPKSRAHGLAQSSAGAVPGVSRWRGRRGMAIAGASLAAMLLVFAAAYVIRVQTASGEVVIHCAEPGIEVSITRDGQPVKGMTLEKSETTERIGVGDIEVTVKGARANEFKVTQDSTTLLRNGQIVVGIELIGKVNVAGGDTPAADIATWQGWPADAPPPAIAPFDADQAKAHQLAWAEYFNVPVEYTNSIGMKFRLIPPGEFMMGSTAAEIEAALKDVGENTYWQDCIKSESPQHKVILTQPIYLGVNEVTQAEYEKVMALNPSHYASMGMGKEAVAGVKTTNHPVEMVSWNDAAEFCAKLSQQEKFKPFYERAGETIKALAGTGYRLSSEAEWEFACRAGTDTAYWCGDKDEDLARAGWYGENCGGRTHPAGELKANPFGMYDMHGNVWEWVRDGWNANEYAQFLEKPAINPDSPFSASSGRVGRGGGLLNPASVCGCSNRLANETATRFHDVGFRVSLSVDAVRQALNAGDDSSPSATTGSTGTAKSPPLAVAPFDAAQAKVHQQSWGDYLGLPVEREVELPGGAKVTFMLIPPGEFLMGSDDDEQQRAVKAVKIATNGEWSPTEIEWEKPQHRVRITRPFYLGKYEVTQAQWQAVTGSNPSGFKESKTHPVENVIWDDIQPFLAKVNASPARAWGEFVLPTEAMWEYSCRAGTTTDWHSGDKETGLSAYAWFQGNSGGKTHAVGELKPNSFGLYDMHGNVEELCGEMYSGDFYKHSPQDDPAFTGGSPDPVRRGAFWGQAAVYLRSANRGSSPRDACHNGLGFRLALTIDMAKLKTAPDATTAVPVGANSPPPAVAPFDEAQAKDHQQAWADHLGVPVEYTNSVGQTMILIPPGEFLMGSSDEQVEAALKAAEKAKADSGIDDRIGKSEQPQHRVVITRPFLMSATEVTIGQYKQFSATGYVTRAEQATRNANAQTYLIGGSDDLPAAHITWNDAVAYCQWLSSQEKRTYRLPTEAEWEYSCRAGTTTQYSFGEDRSELPKHAWYGKNAGDGSHQVGTLLPNPFGLFDMHGNLYEWCGDYFDEKWYGTSASNDPKGPALGSKHVLRGGFWWSSVSDCRSAARLFNSPSSRSSHDGFRVVAELNPTNTPPMAVAPFDQKQAKDHQKAWADYLGLPVEKEVELPGGEKMAFILIPPGEFMMGSTPEEQARFLKEAEAANDHWGMDTIPCEGPQHRVRITRPFYFGKYEVTQAQWISATGNNPSQFKDSAAHPVDDVSWEAIQPFLTKLNQSNTAAKLTFTLPTEAQWEYACRAGTTTPYHCGENKDDLRQHGWLSRNSGGKTHPVGELKPNAFGLFDMHGNVWEWCADWLGRDYYSRSPSDDPMGPTAIANRVLRGGGWRGYPWYCRTTLRGHNMPKNHRDDQGFRLAASIDTEKLKGAPSATSGSPGSANAPSSAIAPFDVNVSAGTDAPGPMRSQRAVRRG